MHVFFLRPRISPCANPYHLLSLIPIYTPMYKTLSNVPPPPTYIPPCTNPYHMFLATHVYDAVTFLAYVDHLQMFTQSNVGVQQEVPSVYRLRRREARKLETS